MRKMKDSGIEWIGEIPESWSVGRVKTAFTRKKEEAHQEDPVVLSLARSGVRIRDLSSGEGQIAESYYNYNLVEAGDFLINPMDLYSGANCSISKVSGVISPAYINLRANNGFDAAYYDYYFKTQYWGMAMFAHGKGVSFDNRWTLNANDLLNYFIPAPCYEEQLAISAYLERQCALIDSVTEKTKASIEEYKKLRQAVITQAVTKGVRGDRPMKDSGIEWIGEMPEEWEVAKTKIIADRIVVGVVIKPADYFDEAGTVPFLRGINIKEYSIVSEPMVYITKESNLANSKSIIHTGDILIVRDGSIGVSCVVPSEYDGANVVSLIIVTCAKNNNPYYFAYSLNSGVGKVQFELMKIGTALTHTSVHSVSNISHTIPSIEEQNEIVQFLDKKCAEIDALIEKKESFLTELEAYKKSLIYEYVTGKKEVPKA